MLRGFNTNQLEGNFEAKIVDEKARCGSEKWDIVVCIAIYAATAAATNRAQFFHFFYMVIEQITMKTL